MWWGALFALGILASCTSGKSDSKQPVAAAPNVDVIVTVDELAADEGLRYWLHLRASDGCAIWKTEFSDGANDSTYQCERCEDSAWVLSWLEKFSTLQSTVSWSSEGAPMTEEYRTALDGDEERMWVVLEASDGPVQPSGVEDYRSVREVAEAMWSEARSRMPDWQKDCQKL